MYRINSLTYSGVSSYRVELRCVDDDGYRFTAKPFPPKLYARQYVNEKKKKKEK